ncbi:MAG: hypothetical protein Q9167_005201 [Letrouitia subvulpina]
MAPNRSSSELGGDPPSKHSPSDNDESDDDLQRLPTAEDDSQDEPTTSAEAQGFLDEQAELGQNFTVRGVLVGAVIGIIICFSNTYFGLQTGWVSAMTMPAALIGFAFFKVVARYIDYPFTPVENVLVQTVAGAVGTMPLGCGFVGVLPALNFILKPEENGPLVLSLGQLILWSLGICFFGVVFAVPLRKEVIIREKLKFPSGTATALVISVLHGNGDEEKIVKHESGLEAVRRRSRDILRRSKSGSRELLNQSSALSADGTGDVQVAPTISENPNDSILGPEADHRGDWKAKIRFLFIAFSVSATYTIISYFIPQIRDLPVFGLPLANQWLWTLNPSPAYIGQGIIMGPETTIHMLLGAVLGWGILSPLAKNKGWAPKKVDEWFGGSKGWIVWVSLAIMLADSVINLGWLALRPLIQYGPLFMSEFRERARRGELSKIFRLNYLSKGSYTVLSSSDESSNRKPKTVSDEPEIDAPPSQLVSNRLVLFLLVLSIAFCIFTTRIVFGNLIPYSAIVVSILLALLLGIMGVRAQGETDINPVSGISKLTQLFFALITPASNPNAIAINLLAGAVSESGALQAGDMMQDLKTGHLLGASPKAQFWGQMIGSGVGAIVSACVYKLYTHVYEIPAGQFQVPTGFVWIFTARLVMGQGLPEMAWQWAVGAGCLWVLLTVMRIKGHGRRWQALVPGGIAVAVASIALGGLIVIYCTYSYIHWQVTAGASRRQLIKKHGCLAPKKLPCIDPILHIDIFLQSFSEIKTNSILENYKKRFDDLGCTTYRTDVLRTAVVVTIDPENIKSVLATDFQSYSIGDDRKKAMGALLGSGIFTTDGAEWQHSRDMLRPNFVRSQIGDVELFEKHVSRLIQAIPRDGSTVDLAPLFFKLTLDISTEFLFGVSTDSLLPDDSPRAKETEAFVEAFVYGTRFIEGKEGLWNMWFRKKRFYAKCATVHAWVDGLIARALEERKSHLNDFDPDSDERAKTGTTRHIFLHDLVTRTTDKLKIRAELLNILLAGRDTTASLLSNLFWSLTHHQPSLHSLYTELGAAGLLRGDADYRDLGFQTLKSLPYLRAALSESLRLHPVVPANGRQALVDTVLPRGGGPDGKSPMLVPKDAMVAYGIYAMQRREDLYGPDAAEWKVERWLDDKEKKGLRVGWEFLPFNGGPRICIGRV